jgi:hypothetical protein
MFDMALALAPTKLKYHRPSHFIITALLVAVCLVSIWPQFIFLTVPVSISDNFKFTPQSAVTTVDEPITKLKTDQNNSLGEIAIHNIYNMSAPFFFNAFPENTPSANITYIYSMSSNLPVITIIPASFTHATGELNSRTSNITVRMNQTVYFKYNYSTTVFEVGIQSKIQPAVLYKIYYSTNNIQFVPANQSDYYTSSTNVFVYNFTHLYQQQNNGSFYLRFEYDVPIPVSQWSVTALSPTENDGYNYLNARTTNIIQKYNLNVSLGIGDGPVLDANFSVTLPGKNNVFNSSFNMYNNNAPNGTFHQTLFRDNVYYFRAQFMDTSNSYVKVGFIFYTNFTVEFKGTVLYEKFWAEDRLVSGFKTRERDYKISIIAGPEDLGLPFLRFNDTSIYFSDTTRRTFISELGRSVTIEDMNKSAPIQTDPDQPASLVGYRAEGISVLGFQYFLYKGEVDVVTVNYNAVRHLQLVVTDNIKIPLVGYKVNLYLGNHAYGTFINQEKIVPYPTKTTDIEGRVSVRNVPRGNYTIEVLDPNGKFVQNLTANSEELTNYIITDIDHFPTEILVYTGIFTAILLLGIALYKKNSPGTLE